MPRVAPIVRSRPGESATQRDTTSDHTASPQTPAPSVPFQAVLNAARSATLSVGTLQGLNGERLDRWQAAQGDPSPRPEQVLEALQAARAYTGRSPRS